MDGQTGSISGLIGTGYPSFRDLNHIVSRQVAIDPTAWRFGCAEGGLSPAAADTHPAERMREMEGVAMGKAAKNTGQSSKKTTVLIVGAGPTGLALACDLRSRG